MPQGSLNKVSPTFVQQADATLSQANPTSGTKYAVSGELGTGAKNARITSIEVQCTWTAQPTPLEIHVTIDGNALIFTKTDPVSATPYFCHVEPGNNATTQTMNVSVTTGGVLLLPFHLEGGSIKIEAEITGGTVSNLSARVKWNKKTRS